MSRQGRPEVELPLLTLLQRGVRWFSEELLEGLDAAGVAPITPAHVAVLAHLDSDVSLSIAELARRAGVTRQTMHRAVTQLVDEGLLVSTPGPGFPRSTLIEVTDAGRRRRDVAATILHDLEHDLETRLGPGELTALRDSMAAVTTRRALGRSTTAQ